ncbi:MAG: aminomethyl-transferring glycine dehydrogenase subunit GcvPA [Clostridiales bacterium]|nr:aminomethyl-transferring glycine dehydrogenase subunit GcvPA [Clostridiales bacterium]
MSIYTPHTDKDLAEMLAAVGVKKLDDLYADAPKGLKVDKINIPEGKSQMLVEKDFAAMAGKNKIYDTILRGCGAYDHYIPAAVTALVNRSEFVTAYTPYQPEISQGVLQCIFEYQTMMCELSGMEVSNASVYDVGTAVGEAIKMCAERKNKAVIVGAVNPQTAAVAKTYCSAGNEKLVQVAPDKNGLVDIKALEAAIDDDTACVIAQCPNYFGLIEDMTKIAETAHAKGAKFVYIFNPVAATVLKTPKECGADIAVAEGQPLGMPLSYGGAYLGILTCDAKMSRRMPGRVVGQTVDKNGKTAYVLTLQAREQHIRREKALSSICSNQALCATTAVVYLAMMGKTGMKQVAEACVSKAHYLAKQLTAIDGVKLKYKGEFFHEFTLETEKYTKAVERKLDKMGILGGYKVNATDSIWCVTEKASREVLDQVVAVFKEGK